MDDILARLTNEQKEMEKSDEHREVRDTLVIEAYESGYTLREIGEAIGKTHQAIARIVRKKAGNRG